MATAWQPSHFALLQSEGWARLDSNQGPRDYESPALTAELQAHLPMKLCKSDRRRKYLLTAC